MQLLQKLSIRASNGPNKLLRVVKQPVTGHLPVAARRVGLSHSAPAVKRLSEFIPALPRTAPLVFVVGAFAHGAIDAPYVDETISISEYPLSAACCLARICNALEALHDIV